MKKIKILTALLTAAILTGSLAVFALPNKFAVDVPYGEPATSDIGADWGSPNKASADMMGWGGAVDNGIPFDYYLLWSEKGLFAAMDITMPNPVALNDGSSLDTSHGGNCDRFQIAFNPGNDRPAEEAPVWFTFSALEEGSFHIVREDAQYNEVDDVTANCPGTAKVDGGRFRTAMFIPWEVININSAPFTAQAGFKMDIHVGICFAGDNAAVVSSEKIEAANVPDDLPNVWATGAMPVTMNLAAKPEPVAEVVAEPEEVLPEAEPVPETPVPLAASPAPQTGDSFAAFTLFILAAFAASALISKRIKSR